MAEFDAMLSSSLIDVTTTDSAANTKPPWLIVAYAVSVTAVAFSADVDVTAFHLSSPSFQ